MDDERDGMERRFERADLLKLAAVAGGAGLVAGRDGRSRRDAHASTAESGRLQVLDWAGYGNDGGQSMFAQYVKKHAGQQAAVHVHDQRVGRAREAPCRAQARPLPAVRRLGEVLRDERARRSRGTRR